MVQFDSNKKYTSKELGELFNYNPSSFTGKAWITTQQTLKDKGYLVQRTLQPNTTNRYYYTIQQGKVNQEIFCEDLLNEKWVDTYCCPDVEVSNLGRVRDKITHKRHKGTLDKKTGYVLVSIKNKTYKLHRIVLKSFTNPEEEKDQIVDHIDGNRTNNCLSNLRFASTLENTNFMLLNRNILQQAITEKLANGYSYEELLTIIQNLPSKKV